MFKSEEDLPTRMMYTAPLNYDPGDTDEDAFALLVTVAVYSNDRIPELPAHCTRDHSALETLLPHSFICKIKPENFISLLNPTCSEFKDTMVSMKQKATKEGFLFVYICTHVITVWGGETNKSKVDRKETAYFCMTDTIWKDARTVAATSVALSSLAAMLNDIPCERKSIALHYAHQAYKKPSVFGSKVLYPPPDLLVRLSELSHSAVIGSCTIGTSTTELVKHCPVLTTRLHDREAEIKLARRARTEEDDHDNDDDDEEDVTDDHDKRHPAGAKVIPAHDKFSGGALASLIEDLKVEWKLPPEEKIIISPYPEPPAPTQERQPNGEYLVTMPSDAQYKEHEKAVLYWKLRRTFAPPFNFIREQIKAYQEVASMAPLQISRTGHMYSLFGEAFKMALEGGVSSTRSPYCIAIEVFQFVHRCVCEQSDVIEKRTYEQEMRIWRDEASVGGENDTEAEGHETASAGSDPKSKKKKKNKKDLKKMQKKAQKAAMLKEPEPQKIAQTPVLFLPSKNMDAAALFPICFRCGPPAQTERPFIKRLGDTEVCLEWYNPPFDGVAPTHYKLYLRSNTRNFLKWTEVQTSAPITQTTFIVRNLPMGVPVQFRVVAYNSVGPAEPSEETIHVTPGESLAVPISFQTKWHRLALGGPLSIIDFMNDHINNRDEQIVGMSKLIAFGQRENGYPKGKTRIHVAEICIRLMETFVGDPEVIASALEVLGYSLCGKRSDEIIEYLLDRGTFREKICNYVVTYRRHDRVVGSILWLRSKIPDIVPLIPTLTADDLFDAENKIMIDDNDASNQELDDEDNGDHKS